MSSMDTVIIIVFSVLGVVMAFGFVFYSNFYRFIYYGNKFEGILSGDWMGKEVMKVPQSNLADSYDLSYFKSFKKNNVRMYIYSLGGGSTMVITFTVVVIPCEKLNSGVYSIQDRYKYLKQTKWSDSETFQTYPLRRCEEFFDIESEFIVACDVFDGFAFFHFQESSLFGSESIIHAKAFAEQYLDES